MASEEKGEQLKSIFFEKIDSIKSPNLSNNEKSSKGGLKNTFFNQVDPTF